MIKKPAAIGLHSNLINKLPAIPPQNPIGPQLDLFIDKQKEINGVGMGVLSDGTAFLSGRGLARLCGIANPRIVELGQNWNLPAPNALTAGVKKILDGKGLSVDKPYIEIKEAGGNPFYAYSDVVCLAVLEYYAFDQPLWAFQYKKQ